MRVILITILLSFFNTTLVSQTTPSLAKDSVLEKIHFINTCKKGLDTLSPFKDDQWQLIDSLNRKISGLLLNVLNDKNSTKYKIENLIELNVTKSSDNKVFVFSFFENTGGSYKSNCNIIYYKNSSELAKAEKLTICAENGGHSDADYGGTIDHIYNLNTKGKKQYLITGSGISCNTCEFNYASSFTIEQTDLKTDFCLLLDFRLGDGTMKFDSKKNALTYDYVIYKDDIYGADCSDAQKTEGNKCHYRGQYKFNGKAFVKNK